ncbi:hypothetical protein [Acrocarpospora macrocephala]|uniref:hypothetical protein n=1 Tax=Acrocarpospora macrocephala TaxID=150177 RepID=UPI0031D0969E
MYSLLDQMTATRWPPLNRAVATAVIHVPAAGLVVLDTLDDRLAGHYRLDAVRGHLLERARDRDTAISCYRPAASRTTSLPERYYLTIQPARLNTRQSATRAVRPQAGPPACPNATI